MEEMLVQVVVKGGRVNSTVVTLAKTVTLTHN